MGPYFTTHPISNIFYLKKITSKEGNAVQCFQRYTNTQIEFLRTRSLGMSQKLLWLGLKQLCSYRNWHQFEIKSLILNVISMSSPLQQVTIFLLGLVSAWFDWDQIRVRLELRLDWIGVWLELYLIIPNQNKPNLISP